MGKFQNIVAIQELKAKVEKMGVKVTDIDMIIADALFSYTNSCVRTEREDLDGITDEYVVGYIYNQQVHELINSYPGAALMIYYLDSNKNYGFVDEKTGNVSRVGMMGDYNPIIGAQKMIAAYIGTTFERAHLFEDQETFKQWQISTSEQRLRHAIVRYGVKPDTYYSERSNPLAYYEEINNVNSYANHRR